MKRLNSTVAALMVFALGTTACVKKRPTRLAQGQGVDAQLITEVGKQRFTITTLAAIDGSLISASEKQVEVADDMPDVVNKLPLVQYKTDSELLGNDLPLRGRPSFKYEGRVQLTDQYLRVLKVGKKADLPFEEWPYAVQLEDGLLGVPLVGYRVRFFRIEHARNEDDKRTSRLIEVSIADKSEATHFRIDRTSRTVFEALDKIDVYPASYFKGEWYYQATIVAAQLGMEGDLGMQQGHDVNFRAASRVRLDLSNKKALQGINLNKDERVRDDDRLNQAYVLSIPLEWKEYQAEVTGRDQGMREEEIHRNEETKRPFVKLKFEEVVTPDEDSIFGALARIQGRNQLADLKLTKDYFSFTILKASSGVKIRYSLRRIDPNQEMAEPRPFFEKDRETFGYFSTTRVFEWDRRIQRRRDVEARQMMNRFNPAQKEIVYHFSTETPKSNEEYGWVRELARYAIHFLDQSFQKAGTSIRVRIDESHDVDLGDLRYNILHIVNPIRSTSNLGYGPSLADSRNGQIISATTNIKLSGFLAGMATQVRAYMRQAGGQMTINAQTSPFTTEANGSVIGVGPLMAVTVNKDGSTRHTPFEFYAYKDKSDLQPSKFQALDYMTPKYKKWIERTDGRGPIRDAEDAFKRARAIMTSSAANELLVEEEFSSGNQTAGSERLIARQIKAFCPEVDEFLARTKKGKDVHTEDEHPVVEKCVNRLVRLPVLTTTIHELLHNFGVMHNFAGSSETDPKNLWTADEIRKNFSGLNGEAFPEEFLPFNEVPTVSTVMDYGGRRSAEAPPVPGKYDIAVLRFMYADQVELKDGRMASVREQSGYKRLAQFNGQVRPYRNCWDLEEKLSSDPMCARWDSGSTPMEVVDNYIEDYWNDVLNTLYRYGQEYRPGTELDLFYQKRLRILIGLKRFYDQWRFHVAEFTGQKDQYLERFTPKTYAELLEKMKTSTLAEQYRVYKPVRDKIAQFFLQVAYMPNRYCVGQNSRGEITAIEFSKLQGELALLQRDSFADACTSPGIQQLLGKRGVKHLTEVGHSISPIRYSTAVNDMKEAADVFGVAPDRLNASKLMAMRMDNSLIHLARSFFPAMMDEPDLRTAFLNQYLERTLRGVDLTSQLKRSLPTLISNKPDVKVEPMPLFQAEANLLKSLGEFVQVGMFIPGKTEVNENRLGAFYTGQVIEGSGDHQALAKKGAAFLSRGNGNLFYALPQNSVSFLAIKRIGEISEKRMLNKAGMNVQELAKVLTPIVGLFPSEAPAKMSAAKFIAVIEALQAILGSQASSGTKLLIRNIFQNYVTVFAAAGGDEVIGNAAKMAEAVKDLKEKITEAEKENPQNPELVAAKQKLVELETQQAAMQKAMEEQDIAQVFSSNPDPAKHLPILQVEVKKRIESAVLDAQKTLDIDPQELDAQVNVLRSLL